MTLDEFLWAAFARKGYELSDRDLWAWTRWMFRAECPADLKGANVQGFYVVNFDYESRVARITHRPPPQLKWCFG